MNTKERLMDNRSYRFSRTFELLISNLVNKIYERQKDEAVITKDEAFVIVESVVTETKEQVYDELKDSLATKEFVRSEIAKAEARLEIKISQVEAKISKVEAKISQAESSILKWMVGIQIASVGLIVTIFKLLS